MSGTNDANQGVKPLDHTQFTSNGAFQTYSNDYAAEQARQAEQRRQQEEAARR